MVRFNRLFAVAAAAAFLSAAIGSAARAVEPYPVELNTAEDNIKCFVCHAEPKMKEQLADGKLKSYYVDPAVFQRSTHGKKPCTSCHKDIRQAPHLKEEKKVECSGCHYVDNIYGAPTSEADRDRYEAFQKSVHKKARDEGNPDVPDCYDCHGSHDIMPPKVEDSRINRQNISRICGGCHVDEYAEYRSSVHGMALEEGVVEAAICIDCHGSHSQQEVHDKDSSVGASELSETCGHCHAEEKLMSKFGIESAQIATYEESYHGKANRFGMETVANCASCHGHHNIRRSDDPASSINPANLAATCGKCHKGANINYTKGKMHVEAGNPDSGIVYWVALAFKILTIGTVCALCLHILLDLIRRFLNRKSAGRGEEHD